MSRSGVQTSSACTSRWSKGVACPGSLLVKDVPEAYHHDLDYLVDQLDWEKNVDPEFKKHNYLEPIDRSGGTGGGLRRQVDRLRPRRWQAALQRLRADRRAGPIGDDQGPGCFWLDRRAGERHDRQAGRGQPQLHSFRRDDRRTRSSSRPSGPAKGCRSTTPAASRS